MCLREEAIFVKSQKCPYHVTFDLDLDLEHTLDAGPCGDRRMQVWLRSSHLSARRSDFHQYAPPCIGSMQAVAMDAALHAVRRQ